VTSSIQEEPDIAVHTIMPATWEVKIGGPWLKASLGKRLSKTLFKTKPGSQAPMAHAWNHSYLGGLDQEDSGSRSAQENSS
jgi:hypothetical protein